ncbi:MAG: nitronate monooxygenase [Acidimicrobiia bacterium]|nr:nitronate monooxygenase [Acidimicrobiia bacterium]
MSTSCSRRRRLRRAPWRSSGPRSPRSIGSSPARSRSATTSPTRRGPSPSTRGGGLNQELARAQFEVVLEERVPVVASGLGSPAFLLDAAHERGMLVWGLVGKARQAKRQLEAGVDAIVAQGYDAAGHTGSTGTFSIVAEVAAIAGTPRSSPPVA